MIVASQAGGSQAKLLFGGMGVGALYMFLAKLLHLFPEEPAVPAADGSWRRFRLASLGSDSDRWEEYLTLRLAD